MRHARVLHVTQPSIAPFNSNHFIVNTFLSVGKGLESSLVGKDHLSPKEILYFLPVLIIIFLLLSLFVPLFFLTRSWVVYIEYSETCFSISFSQVGKTLVPTCITTDDQERGPFDFPIRFPFNWKIEKRGIPIDLSATARNTYTNIRGYSGFSIPSCKS
ncbi:hypothetical protein K445DRAFT_126921 [Daldinia sp. EC12]|nr:hypothetical protein K445DRAFT_126921 [Daldinia sp. EC12]